ncbi:MAG: LPS assembly protein LptD [Cephaloticoccus sp.]|nr:LPS assembly protein LptD [Cephaloticoccus sp.]MCF7761630.1 LPS assembly protein LptD [Cephaloticoccus sp.]
MIRRIWLFFCLVLLASAQVREAGNSSSDISALTTSIDPDSKAVVFSGNARLSDGKILLEADEIRYIYATGVAIATGHVSLTRGPERVLAEKMTYRRRDQTYDIEQVRIGQFPYYVSGQSATGNPDHITVREAELSVREPGPFQPTLVADTLTYIAGKEITAEGAHLGIGQSQPLSLPHFSHRLNLPLASYLSLSAGYRSSLGLFGEAGLHVPVTSGTKLGGTLGIYSARGVMIGPSGHYEVMRGDHEMVGDLRSGFINDHGDKLSDVIGRPVPENRGYVQWWHAQDLTDHLRVTTQLNYWEDSEILRDFKPREFFRIQEPDNYLQAVYTGNNYFLTFFTRAQPNDFQRIQQRLPELRFDLMPVAMGGGFYGDFQASFSALRETPPGSGGPTVKSDRLDAYYAVRRPLTHEDWFSFTPIAGARVTHYNRATGGRANYTRLLGEFGFDAELRTSAVSEYRNDTWRINGIRHLFTPRLAYRFVPQADKGRAFIPAIDNRTFNTYLPPIGLGDTRNIDDLGPTNVLRVGLDNTWQTRADDYGSRDLLVLNLANDFRFSRSPGQRTASDLHGFLAFMPTSWLQFDCYERLATQDFTVQEFNTGMTLRDGDAWSLRFASHFLRQDINEYILQYEQRINEVHDVLLKLHYDARLHRFNEQAFGLRQNLGNTWSVEYLVTVYDGPRRESDFGFNIAVEALGF